MGDFIIQTISQIGETITGKTPSSESPGDFGNATPFVTPSDSFDQKFITHTERSLSAAGVAKLRGKLLPPNSVLVTCIGSAMGKVAMCKVASVSNQQINSIVVRDDYSADYIYYTLTYNYRALRNAATGSTALPLLNKGDFDALKFQIHSDKAEQEKIAAVLSALDAKIDLNNRINAELEALAKTLYDYWFVQFDFPDANGRPYKSSGGKMVWNEVLKREIPAGWEAGSLWSIATYTNGLAMQNFRPEGDDYLPVIKIKEMSDGFGSETERASPSIPRKCVVNDGDVLFSWSATLAVQIWARGRGALNQHIFKVTSMTYPQSFVYFELLNYLDHFRMMAEKRKTTMGHITLDHLRQSFVVTPPIPLIEKVDTMLQPLFDQCLGLKKQNQVLTQLRDWLLPMLMIGQVRVA